MAPRIEDGSFLTVESQESNVLPDGRPHTNPTRNEGTGCASATVLGQRPSLARRVSVDREKGLGSFTSSRGITTVPDPLFSLCLKEYLKNRLTT